MRTGLKLLAATALLALPLSLNAALSAGGGGGGSATKTCKTGEAWDASKNKCVPQQSLNDTDSIYQAGRDLAYAGRYGEAITLLARAADRGDPRILNMLGYSHRMEGRVNVGLGYYQEAVMADPKYTLVREYMGEAYLQLGDLKSAKGQLAALESLCGTGCEEYKELAGHIAAFEAKGI